MKISFTQVCREYLALRGESPDLLPLLDADEYSPVLSIERELSVKLLPAAIEATLETPVMALDEIRSVSLSTIRRDGAPQIMAPADYLCFISLKLPDIEEPVKSLEAPDSLRFALGSRAPAWMVCRENPMVVGERTAEGVILKIFGSEGGIVTLTYVPLPEFDGTTLIISRSAYHKMLKRL